MRTTTILLVGTNRSANDTAHGLRIFGYRVLQPRTPDDCLALILSEKPQLVICEDPCHLANGCSLFDALKCQPEHDCTKYLSLTTLAALVSVKAWDQTERIGYLIKPVYLEQVIMQVRWLIGAPGQNAPAAA